MNRTATLALLVLLALPAAASAEGRFFVGLQIGSYEPEGFADSFDAVYGETLTPIGVRFELVGARWFAALSYSEMAADGERVVFVPGPVGTGISSKLTLRPLRLSAARRFRSGSSWRPYVGAGVTGMSFEESTAFEKASSTEIGVHLMGGLGWAGSGRFRAGGELVYTTVSNAIEGPVAAFYGEDDLGGVELSLYAGWSF
jgi:hypothetical protein